MAFRRGRPGVVPLAAGIALLFGGLAASVPAQTPKNTKPPQDPNKVPVPLPTADNAELSGTFYRGPSSRDTPCVLLIHDRGKDSSKAEWDELAKALQKEGF